MKPCSRLRLSLLTLGALLFVAVAAVSAHAQTIPAEDDTWITGNSTQVDFSNFGNLNLGQLFGSPPVNSVVTFAGAPLNSALGMADTLVSRGSATVNPAINGTFSATLSLKALNMVSSPDLALRDGRVYHITVTLATQGNGGQMDFTTTSAEGGTFNSSFVVTPIFTFTNVNNSSDVHTINCLTNSSVSCSFPMNGSGNWLLSSSSGFDPQSQGIPIVPSGVQVGGYTTVGRARFGGIQAGCGGTKSTGYSCGQNQELHGAGSIGQAIHGTKPPNDCASPSPSPSPTPTPGGGGGAGCAVTTTTGGCLAQSLAIVSTGGGGGGPSPSPSPSPTPQPLCSN
jgi:hypothetical protein